MGGKNLDGDLPVEASVARSIDLTHAAGTELRPDLVWSEPGARGNGHALAIISASRFAACTSILRSWGRSWHGVACLCVEQRACWRRVTLGQFGFNFNLLVGGRIDVRLKRLIARERNFYPVRSRRHQHSSACTLKLAYVSDKKAIQKYGCSRRIHCDFNLGRHLRQRASQRFLHQDAHHLLLPGLDHHSLRKILVTVLAHADRVLTG